MARLRDGNVRQGRTNGRMRWSSREGSVYAGWTLTSFFILLKISILSLLTNNNNNNNSGIAKQRRTISQSEWKRGGKARPHLATLRRLSESLIVSSKVSLYRVSPRERERVMVLRASTFANGISAFGTHAYSSIHILPREIRVKRVNCSLMIRPLLLRSTALCCSASWHDFIELIHPTFMMYIAHIIKGLYITYYQKLSRSVYNTTTHTSKTNS